MMMKVLGVVLLVVSRSVAVLDRVVSLNVTSRFARPVILVRLSECSKVEAKDCEEVAWMAPREVRQVESVALAGKLWHSTFEVLFRDYSGGSAFHALRARVEYSSLEGASRSQKQAQRDLPSFVGAKVKGAWPLMVPPLRQWERSSSAEDENERRFCEVGESFAGPGRWLRERRRLSQVSFFKCEDLIRGTWRWEPDACAPLRLKSPEEARKCATRIGGLTIVGDSLARQLFEALRCILTTQDNDDDELLSFFRTRGPIPKHLGEMQAILNALNSSSSSKGEGGGTLVLNGAGLWQTAYGEVHSYSGALERLVTSALAAPFDAVFLALTTAVHPFHFLADLDFLPDDPHLDHWTKSLGGHVAKTKTKQEIAMTTKRPPEDDMQQASHNRKRQRRRRGRHYSHNRNLSSEDHRRVLSSYNDVNLTRAALAKRAMTLPRAQALADIERHIASARRVPVIDTFSPSLLREDDPFEPTDMRHFGPATITELADLLLATVCSSAT